MHKNTAYKELNFVNVTASYKRDPVYCHSYTNILHSLLERLPSFFRIDKFLRHDKSLCCLVARVSTNSIVCILFCSGTFVTQYWYINLTHYSRTSLKVCSVFAFKILHPFLDNFN